METITPEKKRSINELVKPRSQWRSSFEIAKSKIELCGSEEVKTLIELWSYEIIANDYYKFYQFVGEELLYIVKKELIEQKINEEPLQSWRMRSKGKR